MHRRIRWLAVLAAAGLAACTDDKTTDTPTAPELKPTATTCSFPNLQQAVNAQFTGSTDTYVSQLINDAKNNPATADLKLYEALDTLSAQFGQGTPQTASLVAYRTLLCTTGGAGQLTETTFIPAFGSSGAFAAVGYYNGDNRTVASHDNSRWVLQPPPNKDWNDIATKFPLVIYGAPITIDPAAFTADPPLLSNIFDWRSSPSPVAFQPFVIVGNCEPGAGPTASYIQHNSVANHPSNSGNAEILDFATPDCSGALTQSFKLGWGDRIWKFFAPATAYAAFFLPTSGGRKTALSPDATVSPDSINLEFEIQPDKNINTVGKLLVDKSNAHNPLSVLARSDGNTPFKQTEVFAYLQIVGNSGIDSKICNNWAYSDANGRFTFSAAFPNKSGGSLAQVLTVGTNEDQSAPNAPKLPPGIQPVTDLFNVKNGTVTITPDACVWPYRYNGELNPDGSPKLPPPQTVLQVPAKP